MYIVSPEINYAHKHRVAYVFNSNLNLLNWPNVIATLQKAIKDNIDNMKLSQEEKTILLNQHDDHKKFPFKFRLGIHNLERRSTESKVV